MTWIYSILVAMAFFIVLLTVVYGVPALVTKFPKASVCVVLAAIFLFYVLLTHALMYNSH